MNGLATRRSRYGFDETVSRLQTEIATRGAQVFAVIDHAAEAARVGLTMPPTKLVVFGSPRAGTPLMLLAPTLAIDLPLKLLVAEASDGSITMTYNTVDYLADRYGLSRQLSAALGAVDSLTAALAQPVSAAPE